MSSIRHGNDHRRIRRVDVATVWNTTQWIRQAEQPYDRIMSYKMKKGNIFGDCLCAAVGDSSRAQITLKTS